MWIKAYIPHDWYMKALVYIYNILVYKESLEGNEAWRGGAFSIL
jgi:hypothetical protein